MRRAIIIMTCPRRDGTTYLARALTSLDAAGADEWGAKVVLSDGQYEGGLPPGAAALDPTEHRPWTFRALPGPSGTRVALWRAFALGAELGADETWIGEDDAVACPRALEYAATQAVPPWAAFSSYFEMFELERKVFPQWRSGEPARWERIAAHGRDRRCRQYAGTQALVFPRATLAYLAGCDPREPALEREMPFGPEIAPHASDCAMGWHIDRWDRRDYACHNPSLLRHFGEISTWAADRRPGLASLPQARSYPGDDFDALEQFSAISSQ